MNYLVKVPQLLPPLCAEQFRFRHCRRELPEEAPHGRVIENNVARKDCAKPPWSEPHGLRGHDTAETVRLVALTATPPYDASFAEWSRYEELCGPIDLEIGIPELVRNGDLCPHQDHLILSEPTEDALALLDRRRAAIGKATDLCADRYPALIVMSTTDLLLADPIVSSFQADGLSECLFLALTVARMRGRQCSHRL